MISYDDDPRAGEVTAMAIHAVLYRRFVAFLYRKLYERKATKRRYMVARRIFTHARSETELVDAEIAYEASLVAESIILADDDFYLWTRILYFAYVDDTFGIDSVRTVVWVPEDTNGYYQPDDRAFSLRKSPCAVVRFEAESPAFPHPSDILAAKAKAWGYPSRSHPIYRHGHSPGGSPGSDIGTGSA